MNNLKDDLEYIFQDYLKTPSSAALSAEASQRKEPCESTASLALEQKVSDEPVSPAISLATRANDENYKTESMPGKSSNQSGSERSEKPNCYECKHHRSLVYDAHIECRHPLIENGDRILTGFALIAGIRPSVMKRLNLSGSEYARKKGWFFWPINYDPVWLETCDGFEQI